MVFPAPTEQAILTINGQDYKEWETVSVKHTEFAAPFYTFRLTCSEGQPLAQNFAKMQIVPGDRATITLAEQPAFQGLVYSRQVFFDGQRHYIEIQGASDVLKLSYAHVVHETMEFNKKTAQQIIDSLVQPFGIKFTTEGGALPGKEIDTQRIAPGTTVMEAVETILRSVGNIPLTSNLQGDLVAVVNPTGGGDTVREAILGQNTPGIIMLEGREIIFSQGIYDGTFSMGQGIPNDQKWGTESNQMNKQSGESSTGISGTKQVIPFEMPAFSEDMLQARGDMDRQWQNRDQVTIFATVQGWLKPDGSLWKRSQFVSVISPMLVMDGSLALQAKSVTFSQDNNSGTRTVLELCNKRAWAPVPQGGRI